MIPTDLERQLLKRFLTRKGAAAENADSNFEEQLVVSRDFTGAGFVTEFHRSELLKIGRDNETYQWGAFGAKLNEGIDTGYLFYVDKGFLSALEGYTYGELWPDNIRIIEIYEV